jgi:hypothetical protein
MGLLLFFAAGYAVGARAGSESFDEVIDAVHAIRQSEEFHDFLKALRTHAAHSLRELATTLEKDREPSLDSLSSNDLLDRVRVIVGLR